MVGSYNDYLNKNFQVEAEDHEGEASAEVEEDHPGNYPGLSNNNVYQVVKNARFWCLFASYCQFLKRET